MNDDCVAELKILKPDEKFFTRPRDRFASSEKTTTNDDAVKIFLRVTRCHGCVTETGNNIWMDSLIVSAQLFLGVSTLLHLSSIVVTAVRCESRPRLVNRATLSITL